MKLEEIQVLWNEDKIINIADLGHESVNIPLIHDKYLKIYIDERVRLKGLEFELAKLTKLKANYYLGELGEEELNKLGWDQFLGRITKTQTTILNQYMEADNDIIEVKQRLILIQEKVNYLDSIIKMLNSRGFQIKNALDWLNYSNAKNR